MRLGCMRMITSTRFAPLSTCARGESPSLDAYLFMQLHHFGHPFFTSVTHAQFMDPYEAWSSWDLEGMPSLTHLALNIYDVSLFDEDLLERITGILASCHNLQVLVLVDDLGYGDSAAYELLNEPRVVVLEKRLSIDEWRALAFGGNDIWADAEKVVRGHRSLERLFPAR
ncbi:hypothetical protein HGRIS_008715 [Hohenbuehelia grisea]|uniref:Uncharacterized protein n=1 Tax=Hohenbuehelia grisea TaxID=104357 RepID=A0ABR3J8U8_9AGAR